MLMLLTRKIEEYHSWARQNLWMMFFSVGCRVLLALAFIAAGTPKILGEHFTSLTSMHPMGHFLDAFFRTGYYYTFVGIAQVLAAVLLLIPRTATLGALLYFPIILNICILSLAVRFEGSLVTSPLMVLACLFLLFWDYHKLKWLLPGHHKIANSAYPSWKQMSRKFPYKTAILIFLIMAVVVAFVTHGFDLYPRNTFKDCQSQCEDAANPEDCVQFCECIHKEGKALDDCLNQFDN